MFPRVPRLPDFSQQRTVIGGWTAATAEDEGAGRCETAAAITGLLAGAWRRPQPATAGPDACGFDATAAAQRDRRPSRRALPLNGLRPSRPPGHMPGSRAAPTPSLF